MKLFSRHFGDKDKWCGVWKSALWRGRSSNPKPSANQLAEQSDHIGVRRSDNVDAVMSHKVINEIYRLECK
jgi:hypothetical protein